MNPQHNVEGTDVEREPDVETGSDTDTKPADDGTNGENTDD